MNNIDIKLTLDSDPAEQVMMATHRKGRDLFEKKGFNLNLKSGNLPLGRITGDFDKFSGSLDAATARVLAFTATTTVVYGLATAFNRLFTDSIKLEKQLAGIQAILQTSNSNLQKFSSELFQVANATGQSFDVAAAAASEFARQGLSVEETLKATNAALTFSKIAGTDAAQTVENLTAALNTFAGEALTYTDVLDTIVSLDNAYAISAAGISDGLKRVGSVASASGIQLKEIASLIAVVQQVSARGAPVISNGLKTIFTRLSRTNVQETLNSIGVVTQDSNGEFKSQIEVLTDLANKLDTLSDKQRAFVLEQVAGVYQINTLQATLKSLTGEYSLYDKAIKTVADSSGNAAERLKILTDTTDANLQKLKNNVTQFLAETGKATVKPVLDSFIGIGNKILETLNLGAAAEGGEKAGVSIGKVLLNGISSALAGPGSVLLIVTITRLLSKITKDAFTAVQTLAGLKKVSLVDEKVQMAVNRAIEMGNKGLVDRLRTATSLVEKARILQTLMADMDRKLAMAQVKQAVQTGLAANAKTVAPGARKATGYIPNFSKGFIPNFSKGAIPKPLEELEKKTARLKAYAPGKVIPAPNGGVMSTAETATEIEFKGKKDFVISPPQYSIAGRDHAKDFEKQYGANIYDFIGKKSVTAKGFIPNFLDPEYIEQRKAERTPKAQRTPEQQAVRDANAAEVKRGRKELINIGDFAGGKVYNEKAEEQFRIALKNRNVEWDDKITNVGFEVIEIDVGEDRPQKTLPDGSKKNASTNFKNSILKKPKGDITNLTNKFEAFAIRQLNKRKDRDFNFQKARLTAFGAGNSAVDGYSINPAKNSIDLLEVKSGDWKTPSHISNKIGRFVPENIATLGKPIESLFKESNRAPYSFDTIKLRNILAVPKITKQKFAGSPKKELIDKKWTSTLNYKGEKPSVIAKNLNLLPVTKQDVQRQFGGNANASTPSFTIQNGRLVPNQPAKKPTAKQQYQSTLKSIAEQAKGMRLRAEGFIPNFVRASSMIGRGAEGSFHKLTEDIGVKRFHRSTRAGKAADAYNLTETIKSEFAISKLLARKKELVPGITGPKIPDKLNRALQAGSIRKQIIKEPLARDSVGRDVSMYFGQILRSRLSKAGLLMDDLHGSNYTLNAQGREFINKNKNKFKWKSSLDNPSFLYSSSSSSSFSSMRPLSPLLTPGAKKDYIYDQFVKSGGKATIIDAGFTDVINPNLKKQVSEYRRKTNSKGFIPNFSSPLSSPKLSYAEERKAINESIGAEMTSGFKRSEVSIGSRASFKNDLNPRGLAVFNDEEGTLSKGVSFAKMAKEDLTTKRTYGDSLSGSESKTAAFGFIPNFATSKEIRAQKRAERAQRKKEQRERAANLKPAKVLPSPAVNQPLGSKLFNGPAGMNPFGTKNRPSQTKNSLLVSAKAFNGPGQTSTGSSLPVPSKPANLKPPTVLPTPRALPRSPSNSTGSIYKRKSNNFNFGSNTNPNYFSSSAQTSTGSSRQIGSGISSVPTNITSTGSSTGTAIGSKQFNGPGMNPFGTKNPPLNPRQIGSGISSVPTNIVNRAPAKPNNKGLGTKRMDPSRGLGLATAAAFAIPTLTGMISTPAEGEEQTKGQKIAQGTGEALGAGIMAASVALMIPAFAPLALAVGLGVTAFKGLKSVSDASIPSLSNLKKQNDKLVQSAESQTNSLTEAVKAQEELSQLKESGGDPRKIANAQLKFAKSLSGIKDTNLVSTLTNEKDDVKKQEAIVTYQEKINQDLKFSQGNLATQTIIQQSQKENSSIFDPIVGRKTKTKAFKAEDFSLYLDPIIESLDFTKDTSGKAAERLREVANGTKNWEVFLKEFGTTLGMSEAQVKMATDTYNGLNGEFTEESLKALDKTAAATAIYNKNLKESIVTEKPTFNIDIQGVFDKALKSLTLDTALINYKNFASAGTNLGIEQNRLNLESQSGRLTETVATNRSADLKIKELKLETDKKGTQLISDAVDDLIKIIPKETSTEQKSNILNQANAVLRGGGDISSLENVIKQTLNSSDKSKEVLTQIANISQKTVEGIEKLRIDQAEGTRSINVIAQDQLKESQKINKEEIGRSTLAEPSKYANKLMDTGAVLETDAKIQKLRSKAERSGGARTEQGRKLLLEASNLEMQNDRIKYKDELAQAERYGKDNVVKRTDAERSGMTQIQKNMADDIGQKLKDLNTTRGKSGKSSIFSSQDIKKITDGIQIGGEGAAESRRMLEQKLNNPNYAQDSTVQSFAREIKSVGGSNSIFANNSQMPAVSGANVPIAASAGVAGAGFPTVPSAAGAGAPTVPSVATGGSGVPMIPSAAGAGVPTVPSVATGGSGAQMALGSAQLPTGQSFTSGSMPRNQAFETIQKIVDIEKNNKDYKDFEAEKERNKKLKQQRDVLRATPLSVLNNNTKSVQSLALPNIAPEVSANMGGMGGMAPRATIFDKQQSDFLKRMQSGEQLTEKDFEDLKASVNVNKETGKARDKLDSSRRQSFVEQVQKSGYVFKEDLVSVESKIKSTEESRRKKLNAGQTTEQEDKDLKALEERQALLKLKPEQLEEQIKRSDEDLIKRQQALKPVIADVESMANGTGYSKGLAERLMGGPKRPVIKEKNQPKFHAVGASMLLLESYKQDKDDLEKEMETNASSIKGMEASRSSASTPEEDKDLVDARNKQKELIAKRDAANAKIKEREADLEEAPKLTQSYLQEQKNAIIPETYFEDQQIALYETQLGKGLKERIANGKVAKKGSTEKVDETIEELERDLENRQITIRAEDGTVSGRSSTDEEKAQQNGRLMAAYSERGSIIDRNAKIDAAPLGSPIMEPLTADEQINTQKQIDEIAAKNPQIVAALEEAKRRKREKESQKGKVQSTEGYDVGIARLKDELVNGRTKMGTEGYLKGVFTKTKLTKDEEEKTQKAIEKLEAERKKIQDNNAKITQYDQGIAKADQAYLTQSPLDYYKTAQTQMRGIAPGTELQDRKVKQAEDSIARGKEIEDKLKDKKAKKAEKEREREESSDTRPQIESRLNILREQRDAIKREKPPLTEKEIFEKGYKIKQESSELKRLSAVRTEYRTPEQKARIDALNKEGTAKRVRFGNPRYETADVRDEVLRREKASQSEDLIIAERLINEEQIKLKQLDFETKNEDADIANLESRKYTPEKMAEEEKRLADARASKQASAGKVQSTKGYDTQISSFEDLLKNGRTTLGPKGEKVITPLTEEEKIKTQTSLQQAREEKAATESQNAQIAQLQGKQDKAKQRLKFSDPQEYLKILNEEEALPDAKDEKARQEEIKAAQDRASRLDPVKMQNAAIAKLKASKDPNLQGVGAQMESISQKELELKTLGSDSSKEGKEKSDVLKKQIEEEKQKLGAAYEKNQGAIDQTLYKGQVAPMLAEKITNPEDQLKVTEFNDKVQERQAKEAELDPINKKIGDIEAKRKERSAVASEAGKALTGDGADNDRKRAIFSKFTSGELTAEEANKQSGGQLGAAFDRVSKNRMNKQASDQAKADLATSGDTAEERIRKKEVYGKFSRGEITQAEADKQTGGGLKAAFAKVVPDQNAPKFGDLNNVGNIKEEEKRKAEIEKQVAKTKEEENTLGAAIKPLLDAVTALTAAQTATKEGGAAGTTTEGGAAAPTGQGGEKKITTNSNVNVTVTGGSLTDAHVVQLQEGLQTFTIDNINKAFVNAGLPAPNLGPPAATTAVV